MIIFSYVILLFFAKKLHMAKKSFRVLFLKDLNTASVVERSLTAAILDISSATETLECWQNLSKLTNQKVYQILVFRNDLFLSLPTGVVSLPLAALLFIFSHSVFLASPQLTERQEEANFGHKTLVLELEVQSKFLF